MSSSYAAAADTTPVDRQTKRVRFEAMRAAYWSERSGGGFDSHWLELGEFLQPRRTRFWTSDRNKGDKRNQKIIDSTARFSARTLSSGLHAGLTSPARPWMKLTTPDPDLAENEAVKEWLHTVTTRMLTVFLQSNLYNALPILYQDMGVFGTAAMAVLQDDHDLFRAYAYPIGSYAIGLDHRGVATTFIRDYEMTVRSVVQTFGVQPGRKDIDWSGISSIVKTAWDRGNYEQGVPVCWVVLPNEDADPYNPRSKFLPWTSCHFERGAAGRAANDSDKLLRESGFKSFPIMAPRWDVNSPEDSYGTDCPGMTALGDVKQLQMMQRDKARAIKKQIDPPLVGPNALRTQKTSLLSGDITYVDVREGQQGLRSIHEVNLNLADLRADMQETRYRIQRAFFEDLFLMLANSQAPDQTQQPMTAREVDERHEEKLLALGPVLERTNDELLDPLVDRVFGLMLAADLIPQAPPDLHGVKLKVEYTSILAQAQKLVGVVGLDRFLASTTPLLASYPTMRHKIRPFQIVTSYGEMLGIDPRTIVPDEDAQKEADAEAQAQQTAMANEQAAKLAPAAAAAGAKPVAPNSVLDQIMANLGGAQGGPAGVAGVGA